MRISIFTLRLVTIERIPKVKLTLTILAVVNKRVGEMLRLDVVLHVVLGLVGEVLADGADPGVGGGAHRLLLSDYELVKVDRCAGSRLT